MYACVSAIYIYVCIHDGEKVTEFLNISGTLRFVRFFLTVNCVIFEPSKYR